VAKRFFGIRNKDFKHHIKTINPNRKWRDLYVVASRSGGRPSSLEIEQAWDDLLYLSFERRKGKQTSFLSLGGWEWPIFTIIFGVTQHHGRILRATCTTI
jgi:hypothetical protein